MTLSLIASLKETSKINKRSNRCYNGLFWSINFQSYPPFSSYSETLLFLFSASSNSSTNGNNNDSNNNMNGEENGIDNASTNGLENGTRNGLITSESEHSHSENESGTNSAIPRVTTRKAWSDYCSNKGRSSNSEEENNNGMYHKWFFTLGFLNFTELWSVLSRTENNWEKLWFMRKSVPETGNTFLYCFETDYSLYLLYNFFQVIFLIQSFAENV